MTDFVATLVSNPNKPALSDALLSQLAQALPERAKLIRLDRQIAIDVAFRPVRKPNSTKYRLKSANRFPANRSISLFSRFNIGAKACSSPIWIRP